MGIVVDASVALKWVVEENGSDKAAALSNESLFAPSIWMVEAGNALWRLARRGEISQAEARDRLSRLRRAPVTIFGIEADTDAALELSLQIDHPIYDCLYLALAIRVGVPLITADQKFHAAVLKSKGHNGIVRLLDQFEPAAPT